MDGCLLLSKKLVEVRGHGTTWSIEACWLGKELSWDSLAGFRSLLEKGF